MAIIFKHKLTIILALVVAAALGLCVYSVRQYQTSGAAAAGLGADQPGMQQAGSGFGQSVGRRMGSDAAAPSRGPGSQPRQAPGQGGADRAARTQPGAGGGGSDARMQPGAGGGGSDASSGGRADRPQPGAGPRDSGGRFGGTASAAAGHSTALAVYTSLFFLLTAIGYLAAVRMKPLLRVSGAQSRALLWAVLCTGLLLRIAAAPWIAGFPFDISLFKSWALSAADHFRSFYLKGSSDYPPFYVYILYMIGKLAGMPGLSAYMTLLIKLPSILADAATAYLLFRIARKRVSSGISLLLAAFYMFNPAVFINSTLWGQVDSFFTLIVIAAVALLSRNHLGWSTVCFTAAMLMKPQGILYLPLLGFELIRSRQWKAWLLAAAAAIGTTLTVALPFSAGQSPFWLFKLYAGTVNEYPYASVNAYNLFALLGANYKPDTSTLFLFSYHTWGLAFIVLISLFSWRVYHQGGGRLASLAALLQIAGVFTFSSSMHERYLFPAAALALLAYSALRDRRLLWLAAGFSLTVFMNTYAVFYNAAAGGAAYNLTLVTTSLINVLLVLYLLKVAKDAAFTQRNKHRSEQAAVKAGGTTIRS